LAIVDLSDDGREPFVSADGSVAVVFNGEIYNHEELRRRFDLHTVGRCDGAILPELWHLLGTRSFEMLRGMFAIAVYDTRNDSVTLARDPFGIKPAWWTSLADGSIVFASEPRALLPISGPTELNPTAIVDYLAFGAVGRNLSPYASIHCVPPNTWIGFQADGHRATGLVRSELLSKPAHHDGGELRTAFLDTVRAHTMSDVPTAILLSSGLDSAAIAWACALQDYKTSCVTVAFSDRDPEDVAASRLARSLGHDHEIVAERPDAESVERFFVAMQRPTVDGLNAFLVSHGIHRLGIKVALSGIGGDEMLAGYESFRLLRPLRLLRAADTVQITRLLSIPMARKLAARWVGSKASRLISSPDTRSAERLGDLMRRVLLDEEIARLTPHRPEPPGRAAATAGDVSALSLSRMEIERYLSSTLLPDADAFSMAWSVEMRVPYVDVPFAQTALAVDPQRGVGKRRFARLLADPRLTDIARRPKQGFTLPMDSWMRSGPLRPYLELARRPDAPVRQALRSAAVDELLDAWSAGRCTWSRAWLIVALDAWLRSLGAHLRLPG